MWMESRCNNDNGLNFETGWWVHRCFFIMTHSCLYITILRMYYNIKHEKGKSPVVTADT